jgi:Tfp pilus assembly pilus retraction ATPase PilT
VNRPDIRVITAENPVEYNIDGIVQVAVNPDITWPRTGCFDFATALRSFLRLDPDVIMVGEVRDKETAHIAMEAAMTGHLVLLHHPHQRRGVDRVASGRNGPPGLSGGEHVEMRFGPASLPDDLPGLQRPRAFERR